MEPDLIRCGAEAPPRPDGPSRTLLIDLSRRSPSDLRTTLRVDVPKKGTPNVYLRAPTPLCEHFIWPEFSIT